MNGSVFEYPEKRLQRRHGPQGYLRHESFRPWLRDEFTFQCVYCLNRESWGQVTGDFEVDHFLPQSIHPDKKLNYENLVYACRRCNGAKGNGIIADPFYSLHTESIRCQNGEVTGKSLEAQRTIRVLDLNSPNMIRWRLLFAQIVDLALEHDESLLEMLTGLPANLTDLRRMKPPHNSRPEGVADSWFSRRVKSHDS